MGAILISLALMLAAVIGILWYRSRQRRLEENPAFDIAGRPLPTSCRLGNHDLPDMIAGMSWEEVPCWSCGMLPLAALDPIPDGDWLEPWIAVAYYGSIYDVNSYTLHYRWPRITTFTLLERSERSVKLRARVDDFRTGTSAYTLTFGPGLTIELLGGAITLEADSEEIASVITGKEKELETPTGSIRADLFTARRGWTARDSKQLAFQDADGRLSGRIPLPPDLLGLVLNPWALAVLDDRPAVWPELAQPIEEQPELVWREAGMDLEHLNVWAEQDGDTIALTQLRLQEVDEGAVWKISDDGITVTTGQIRRNDMNGPYSKDPNAWTKSIGNDGDEPLPDTEWIESQESRFPVEPLLAFWDKEQQCITIPGTSGETLTIQKHDKSGYPFAVALLEHPDDGGKTPLGLTNRAYNLLHAWTAERAEPAKVHA